MKNIIVILLLSLSIGSIAQDAVIESVTIKRLETYDVSTGPHVAFPTIIRLPNDSLLIAYRRGAGHVEASGRIVKRFGSPDGSWWSPEEVIINNAGIDDRGAALTLLSDGRVMFSFFTYKPGVSFPFPPIPAILSVHVAFSSDNGHTFSTPVSIDGNESLALPPGSFFNGHAYELTDGSEFKIYAASIAALEVNGRIIIPAYGGDALINDTVPGSIISDPWRIYFFESSDMGVSWTKYPVAENYLPDSWLTEPDIIKRNNESYIMHFRCSDDPENTMGAGPLRQSVFGNDLDQFQPDQEFSFVGHAPDIFRLSSGVLVSGFRVVNPGPSSQDICFIYSIDDGVNWSDTIKVLQGTIESGYPTFTELASDKLLIAYYTSGGLKIKATIYDFKVLLSCESLESASLFLDTESNDVNEEYVAIYPNPNQGYFHVETGSVFSGEVKMRITDSKGSILYNEKFLNMIDSKIEVNIEGVGPGFYFVEISDRDISVTKKILIGS